MSAQGNPLYQFADCELDAREHRLLVRGRPVTLTPKVFETLVLLVERAGHVVSKDELMAALWPRGFVHESNLTKHIWLIRRALGDGEDENRYIETVPKLGYRFVAAVQSVCANAVNGAGVVNDNEPTVPSLPVDPGESPRLDARSRTLPGPASAANRLHVLRWQVLVPALLVLLIGGLLTAGWWAWQSQREVPGSAAISDSSAVAIVDFNNLSGNAKDAWLGPALEQMLATELAVNGKLHAVAEELVRPARADLPVPEAGGYASPSLATLQRRLGMHYVLSGAYLVSGTPDAPHLRVDLTVQDAVTGKTFASISRQAAVDALPGLVAQIGGELRNRFGEETAGAVVLKQVAAEQPPTSEVARHFGFALQALDQYDPARARDELLQAIAQAPGYAPAYAYLARSWSMLGYRAKAIAASSQALHYATGLPDEDRLQIQAQQFELQADHGQAVAAYEKLVSLRPRNPDYRLQLVFAFASAGKHDQANAALAALRHLPGLDADPRVELAAANIASSSADPQAYVRHARRALQLAQRRGESGLIAAAELRLGMALDQDAQAEPLLRQAASDYRRIDNPHGEALAWQNLANLQNGRNDIAASRETYQRAMTIYQGIGDLSGQAAIYDDLSRMLWDAGDRDGTETALRQALKIARETNDPARQAWSLTGLATVLSDESASDDVAAMYGEAIALDRQAGSRTHLVFAQASYADLLRMRGQLDQARDMCMQAQAGARAFKDASQAALADFECAQVALDQGDLDQATVTFSRLEQQAIAAKDSFGVANAQLELGQIAMGKGQWEDARATLQKSLQGWAASKEAAGEATAGALLALCESALGDTSARDKSAKAARDLRGRISERAEVFQLDIALAELAGVTGADPNAMHTLRTLTDDATKRRWVGLAFEARLAAQRLLERDGDHAAAKASRDALNADAQRSGYGWVSRQLTRLATSPSPPPR
ncbi:MAG: winged helix-turn-helix domain-containing protein [Rhodanobacter sp.]